MKLGRKVFFGLLQVPFKINYYYCISLSWYFKFQKPKRKRFIFYFFSDKTLKSKVRPQRAPHQGGKDDASLRFLGSQSDDIVFATPRWLAGAAN